MTRADVKIKITLARSFQRWTRILITQKCPITTPEQTAAQPTSLMEPASTGLHSIWWCCSSCASWQCTWRGGSLRWFTHAAGNLSNPNPTPHQPGSPFGYSLPHPTLCDSCRQAQLLAALQLLSLSGIPDCHLGAEAKPRCLHPLAADFYTQAVHLLPAGPLSARLQSTGADRHERACRLR